MFVRIVFVDVLHWEICERFEWLNIVLMLWEYLSKRNDNIQQLFYNALHGQIKPILTKCRCLFFIVMHFTKLSQQNNWDMRHLYSLTYIKLHKTINLQHPCVSIIQE